jgi:hypothetical protein
MALFDGLAKWAEAEVEHRCRRVEASWAGVPGITISREGGRLVLSGNGLMRRWLGDVRLRFARWNNQ